VWGARAGLRFSSMRNPECREKKLVAFSCKGRGFCPSCMGRRMAESAANLVDHVLPRVPLRQFVFTVPFELRARLAYDGKLLGAVGRIFVDSVLGFYRRTMRDVWRAGTGHSGAVTAGLSALIAFAQGTATAGAQSAAPLIAEQPPQKSRKPSWYGWQIVSADAAAFALIIAGTKLEEGGPILGGVSVYVFSGPVIHGVHRQPGAAAISFGLRTLAPLTLAVVSTDPMTHDGTETGLMMGAVLATSVDALLLSYDSGSRGHRGRYDAAARPRFMPALAITGRQKALSLTGTF
jgi:hypothetical protein